MIRILTLALLGLGLGAEDLNGTLTIFHAGSLSVPMKEMTAAYQKVHPGVQFRLEAAGSRDCARKVSELGKPCDILASADYLVIDNLLIPKHATWNIRFATNEMCIVYREQSRRAAEISAATWPDILLDPKVAFGRANPDADPCGYRAVLTCKLAERHLKKEGLAAAILAKDVQHIRPKETDLLALLESGTIDYLFLYRSVAQQHGLKYLVLPDEINLKSAALAEHYKTVSVELAGKEPGTKVTQVGEPMVYGVTIPTTAPSPKLAEAFVAFMLTADQGMALIEKLGQPSAVPSPTPTYAAIPESLKKFAKPVP